MSRTYRRRHTTQNGMWTDLEYYTSELVYPFGDIWYFSASARVPFKKNSPEYNKGKARFHSDMGTTSFKEPGPSWFRNLFTERPLRRYNKNELRKFMLDSEYEPMCLERGRLDYWT